MYEVFEEDQIKYSRIQRISLETPPQWASEQMDLVSLIATLQEYAEQAGWDD